MDESMFEDFKIEAYEIFEEAEDGLLNIERGEDFTENYNSIFRAFHSLKGAAGMFGIENLQAHMHKLESLYEKTKENGQMTKAEIDYFLSGVDTAKLILDQNPSEFHHVETLEQINNKNLAETPSETPAKAPVETPKVETISEPPPVQKEVPPPAPEVKAPPVEEKSPEIKATPTASSNGIDLHIDEFVKSFFERNVKISVYVEASLKDSLSHYLLGTRPRYFSSFKDLNYQDVDILLTSKDRFIQEDPPINTIVYDQSLAPTEFESLYKSGACFVFSNDYPVSLVQLMMMKSLDLKSKSQADFDIILYSILNKYSKNNKELLRFVKDDIKRYLKKKI